MESLGGCLRWSFNLALEIKRPSDQATSRLLRNDWIVSRCRSVRESIVQPDRRPMIPARPARSLGLSDSDSVSDLVFFFFFWFSVYRMGKLEVERLETREISEAAVLCGVCMQSNERFSLLHNVGPRSHANRYLQMDTHKRPCLCWLWVLFPIAVADFHSFITNLIESPRLPGPGQFSVACRRLHLANGYELIFDCRLPLSRIAYVYEIEKG